MNAAALLRLLTIVLLPLTLRAEPPSPVPPASAPATGQNKAGDDLLDGNYVVTLSPVEKDAAGFAIITAKRDFGLVFDATSMAFNAALIPQKDGAYLLDYRLKGADGTGLIVSSVLLRLGEPVQIIKNGKHFYNVRLDRYPAPEPAKAAAAGR